MTHKGLPLGADFGLKLGLPPAAAGAARPDLHDGNALHR